MGEFCIDWEQISGTWSQQFFGIEFVVVYDFDGNGFNDNWELPMAPKV